MARVTVGFDESAKKSWHYLVAKFGLSLFTAGTDHSFRRSAFTDAYEVLWFIVPIAVYIVCRVFEKKEKKDVERVRNDD